MLAEAVPSGCRPCLRFQCLVGDTGGTDAILAGMLPGPFDTVSNALTYLVGVALALAAWRGSWRGRPLPGVPRRRPLLVGHRGTRGIEPENTLAAFRRAFDEGLDGVEFDVQRSLDGELVLTHDEEVGGRPVARQSYGQLRERVPELATLGELFELARQYPGRLLNLEIKARGWRTRGLERAVVRAVLASGLADRVLVSSFNPLSLARVRLFAPRMRVALLYDASTMERPGGRPRPGWLHVDALHPGHALADRRLVVSAHARGVAVNVWTVNEPDTVRALRALGVDAIMGDDPARLRRSIVGGEEEWNRSSSSSAPTTTSSSRRA